MLKGFVCFKTFDCCCPAAKLGLGLMTWGWSVLPAPRLELGSVEVYQGRPAFPAHSDPLMSLYLLEKTLSLPIIEEHRKEGGRKGDKQIELGSLPPVKGWTAGRGGSCPCFLGLTLGQSDPKLTLLSLWPLGRIETGSFTTRP